MRKAISVVLTCVLATSLLAACSGNNNNRSDGTNGSPVTPTATDKPALLNDTGFPIVNEPITMSAMVMLSPA